GWRICGHFVVSDLQLGHGGEFVLQLPPCIWSEVGIVLPHLSLDSPTLIVDGAGDTENLASGPAPSVGSGEVGHAAVQLGPGGAVLDGLSEEPHGLEAAGTGHPRNVGRED